MAISATTEWRIRTGGDDANGAAYDSAQSGVISTTLNGAITNSATSITVASASGWPSSGNYYARIGPVGAEGTDGLNEVVLVTGGQGTTTWTVTRGQLGTTGTAFASGVVVNNNLARCNTAAFSGTDGTSNASTTFTSASATFNATVVGNHLRLASGTNGTVGYYRITAFTDANTITLDRNCSTGAMTNGAWKIGGAAANISTSAIFNSSSAAGNKCVPGNIIYIRGAGSRLPSVADYTVTTEMYVVQGDTTNGDVTLWGEYGRPFITGNGRNYRGGGYTVSRSIIWSRTGAGGNAGNPLLDNFDFYDSVYNGTNQDVLGVGIMRFCIFSHIYGHTSKPSVAGTYALMAASTRNAITYGCLIENSRLDGVANSSVINSVVRNCLGNGVVISSGNADNARSLSGNVITNNDKHGIDISSFANMSWYTICNNLIANHSVAGKYGINSSVSVVTAQTAFTNNAFYNNTANYNNINAGPNDVVCTADPFTNAAGGDYTLNNTAGGGQALRDGGLPGQMPGLSTTDVYSPIGLLATPASGGGLLRHPGMSGGMNG